MADATWQQVLADSVTEPRELLSLLNLPSHLLPGALRGSSNFKTKVPKTFLSRIQKGNPEDPLLKQILPLGEECNDVSGFSTDPLAEQNNNPTEGIIHKYKERVLLIISTACAVNCRFCFRRHFPYDNNQMGHSAFTDALEYIAKDQSIKEVIFSGGDPLAISDYRLTKIVNYLADILHLETIRIHTRLPIMIPQRITPELINGLTSTRLSSVIVIHCNHANEIDGAVKLSMEKIRSAGITLLNQSTLLRGVNDSASALKALSHSLFRAGVLPYYLHMLDKVKGAAHFDVDETTARALIREMIATSPGYLVPKLVREEAGASGKTPVMINE